MTQCGKSSLYLFDQTLNLKHTKLSKKPLLINYLYQHLTKILPFNRYQLITESNHLMILRAKDN